MPVLVPTTDELQALDHEVADLSQRLQALDTRVRALESDAPKPPEPERPDPEPPEPEPPEPPIQPEPPAGELSATVVLNGRSYQFTEGSATTLEDYVDPDGRFSMTCKRAKHPDLEHYSVDFRRVPGWSCIVFDYGNALITSEPPNLPAHNVTITNDDEGAHYTDVFDLPAHWWASRWRWQSGPWPHMRDFDALVAKHWLPKLDPVVNKNTARPYAPPVYTPMGLAGIHPGMPATGGRPDIGFLTDWQGEYACTGAPAMLEGVLAQGEAGGTIPWHHRDPEHGRVLDIMNDPYKWATCYWHNSARPFVQQAKGSGITVDVSHMPAVAWMPFALTGDPYYLETLHAQANYCFLDTPRNWNEREVWQMPGTGQTRAMAWNLRTIVQALAGTPDIVPNWLLPRSVFQQQLDQCLKGLTLIMAEQGGNRTGLNAIDVGLPGNDEGGASGHYPGGCYSRSWQTSFFVQAAAFGATLFPELKPVCAYIARNHLARTDGMKWDASYPAPYSLLLRPARDAPWFANWDECWAANAPLLGSDPPIKNRMTSFKDYEGGVWAGLAALVHARRAGITEIPAEIDEVASRYYGAMQGLLGVSGNFLTWNNSYAR